MSLSPGDVIDGKYEIVRVLGEGGMGAVYEGLNVRIHRRVAIKVLHGHVAQNAEAVERFEREAQAAGRIGSSHIVEVLDLGDLAGGERYMVMEFLEGQSLSDRVATRGRLSAAELYPIATQLLEGLAAAHAAGIVHRDLKPENVYLITSKRDGQEDFVKILDFGISKFNTSSGEFSMTRTGTVMGTPYYMSPEQAKGAREIDQRADLYAVGVILYECSSGRVPFHAQTFNELLFKIVLEDPPPLRELEKNLDEGFVQVVAKAMARDMADRYQSASEFQQALQSWARDQSLEVGGPVGHTLPFGAARPSPRVAEPPALPKRAVQTNPSWSATPSDKAKAKNLPWIVGSVLSLSALGFAFALFGRGHPPSEAERLEIQHAAEANLAEQQRATDEARQAAEQAFAEQQRATDEARQATEQALAEAEAGQGSAAAQAGEPDTADESIEANPPPLPLKVPPKKTATNKAAPPPTVKPKPPPPPEPPASEKATTSAGRTIRSTL